MKKKTLSTFEKLSIKIKNDLGYDVVNLKRTYVGRNMKASGAQVWMGRMKDSLMEIGGYTPASELLKAKTLSKGVSWGMANIEIVDKDAK